MPFTNLPADLRELSSRIGEGSESHPTTSRHSSFSTANAIPPSRTPLSRRDTPPVEISAPSPLINNTFTGFEREYGPFSSIPSTMPHATSSGSKPQISVVLDQPYLVLNGTGPDVESTRMTGKVLLNLPEATSLREITLQFRGKARIPMPASESLINNTASITYVICNHEWHFLDAPTSTTSSAPSTSKKHHHPARTLKAGQHAFPFHLDIGGTLPASLTTPVLGGASIAYKLRAVALRPALSLSPNLTYTVPVSILRGFTPDALEYQQTLEIENTWPGKVMYSVVLPHKAWAGGDELVARLTLSPLSKGVKVLGVVSALWELTKVWARSGWVEDNKVIVWGRSEIRRGKAISVPMTGFGTWQGLGIGNVRGGWEGESAAASLGFIASYTHEDDQQNANTRLENEVRARDAEEGYVNHDVVTLVKMRIPPTTFGQHGKQPPSRPATPGTATPPYPYPLGTTPSAPHSAGSSQPSTPGTDAPAPHLTPSHSVDPIHTSHRIRWSIFLLNPDGHVSELRCSLPVHILDGRLLEEAKGSSLPVRRVLFSRRQEFGVLGEQHELESHRNADEDEYQNDEGPDSQFLEADRQLPSYHAHLRDRVANMFLPEGATMRVNNPWIPSPLPTSPDVEHGTGSGWQSPLPLPTGFGVSGADSMPNSPRLRGLDMPAGDIPYTPPRVSSSSQLQRENRNPSYGTFPTLPPPVAAASSSSGNPHDRHIINGPSPLEYVNSELLLSLNNESTRPPSGGLSQSRPQSRHGSRPGSRWGSRPHSRNASPERDSALAHNGEPCSPGSEHGHGHGHGHHGLRHFIKATMRPFTALTSHSHSHSSSHSHSNAHSHVSSARTSPTDSTTSLATPSSQSVPSSAHSHFGFGNSHSHPHLHHSHTSHIAPSPLAGSRSASHGSLAHIASAPAVTTSSSSGPDDLRRALAEVPGYSVAARGFMGGVPPLSSLQGLPSYEEASRQRRPFPTNRSHLSNERAEEDVDSDDGEGVIEMRVRGR